MKRILFYLMTCLSLFSLNEATAQCDNLALAFEGSTINSPITDFISLAPSPVSGNSNFTVEGWFLTTGAPLNIPQFRRLFTLSGTTRFEVGENGNNLVLFWSDATPANSFNVLAPISTNSWHHLAVVRQGASVLVYLDGVSVASLTGLGALNTNLFHVGHWGGGTTPFQDWEGQVDEVRLWNTVRTQTQISDFKDCSIAVAGASPDLMVNWTFDQTAQGVVGGGSNSLPGLMATDFSGNGNDGTLNNFTLAGLTSNFVCNTCPPIFSLAITDLGSQSISLASICSGAGAHFCVNQNGAQVTGLAGATVTWQYMDGTGNWAAVPNTLFMGFCFGVPSIDISAICASSSTGFVDRKYRATITKGPPNQTCTYVTAERLLRIHCPVKNLAIGLTPPIPNPPNIALCEGTNYTTTVSLSSTDAFIPSGLPTNGDLGIQWCINGVHNPSFDNMPSFVYSGQPLFPDLCFEAKVGNGICPLMTTKICIPVDKVPMCGTIDVKPELALMTDLNTSIYDPFDYLLCPGNDAELYMLNPLDFKDCDAVWQFMFPTVGTWNDLKGTGNATQNTNVLPQLPPNPPSPSLWPVGETCILYRIECRPKNYPLSDCAPCHSNIVQICLKTPKPAPVISATDNPICKQGAITSSTISVSPYDPNCSYNWYCNGVLVDTNVPFIIATQPACYWVEVFDGCFIQTSNPLNLEVCEIVPVIECPQDNPCACLGVPITLIGCNSYNTCGNTGPLPLVFSWSADTPGPITVSGPNGCEATHTPDPGGTNYTLTVTDPNTGCTATAAQFSIKPCQ